MPWGVYERIGGEENKREIELYYSASEITLREEVGRERLLRIFDTEKEAREYIANLRTVYIIEEERKKYGHPGPIEEFMRS